MSPRIRHSVRPARLGALGALIALGLSAGSARAAGTRCEIRVVPPGHPAWDRAAHDAAEKLAAHPAQGDCATAVVEVGQSGAHLVFTTRDGRRAERQLARPRELAPALEALRVTGDVAPPVKAAGDPRPAPVPHDHGTPPAKPPLAREEPPVVHFGAAAGGRIGAHALVTPVLDAFASLSLERWELGVFGQWEVGYHEIANEADPRRRSSGLAAGVTFGRREPVSGSLALLGGARFGLAALDEDVARNNPAVSRAEGRLGAYVGAVVPRHGTARLRAELVGEIVPNHIGQTPESVTGQPLMPWWATTLTVGVELGRR